MLIGADRGRVWNSNVDGFPFIPFGHKNKIRTFEAGDKSPGGGGSVGRENVFECFTGDIRARRDGALFKKRKSRVCGRGSGGIGRSKWFEVRFGASVNDLPKSIGLNACTTNRSFVQMEHSSIVVNTQLQKDLCFLWRFVKNHEYRPSLPTDLLDLRTMTEVAVP
ncbi:hypothetical protein AVEN_154925-1 [Araneus ventricosus]|uniref:Uncharacterized protein n=1 Tax=Araneus ventricosus TaxID=182803 RepID=A0A4Y2A7D5_ARAVE|nr:hypothetical protein AVEN_154925-1 [Araneus ventricosus]